jgi:hypothetical protein
MSETRLPAEIWTKRVPVNDGKKSGDFRTVKIELFPAGLWRFHWEPCSPAFFPKVPLQTEARLDYWRSRYRIRVNGRFVRARAKYETFTKAQIRARYFS